MCVSHTCVTFVCLLVFACAFFVRLCVTWSRQLCLYAYGSTCAFVLETSITCCLCVCVCVCQSVWVFVYLCVLMRMSGLYNCASESIRYVCIVLGMYDWFSGLHAGVYVLFGCVRGGVCVSCVCVRRSACVVSLLACQSLCLVSCVCNV